MKLFSFAIILLVLLNVGPDEYQKTYYNNGQIKSEGWLSDNKKTEYWKFYFENGNLKSEGHFNNNLKNKILEIL